MVDAPDTSQLDSGSVALLRGQLEPGEQLLWAGKPQWWCSLPPFFTTLGATVIILSPMLWLLRQLSLSRDAAQFVLLIMVFAAMGFSRRIAVYNVDRESLFGITNRRAIRMWPLHSVSLVDEKRKPVAVRRRIFGRLTIGDISIRRWNGIPRYVKPGVTAFLDFFAIADRDEAMRTALEAQRRELQEQSKAPAA